ncbi:5'-3' exoribonuclease 2 [Sorochytrium milnesiophthora]
MGVPSLFRWLAEKYPKTCFAVAEEQPQNINGVVIPADLSKPNPNGVEYDNLYLDMNGIIHPCCRPENGQAPATEDDMFIAIFAYIDRIMGMVRPRKLLYLAIDGVAPRAKMNQQRSRRFRAAQESAESAEAQRELREQFLAIANDGKEFFVDEDGNTEQKEKFDSNCITPGTPFMYRLAKALRYYIAERMTTEPGWRNLAVLLSDASVPGEGEHKIMDYIRRQRCDKDYNANLTHVMYGLDADLIMLGLSTHEARFTILREDVFVQDREKECCKTCGQLGHQTHQCMKSKQEVAALIAAKFANAEPKPFIFFHLGILREYLEAELREVVCGFKFDFERMIDDWVFLCFLVGNDFLPHLPCLKIREGAIDLLTDLYRISSRKMGGYITDHGEVNLERFQYILTELGQHEPAIFKKRRELDLEFERKRELQAEARAREAEHRSEASSTPTPTPTAPQPAPASGPPGTGVSQNSSVVAQRSQMRMQGFDISMQAQPLGRTKGKAIMSNKLAAAALRPELQDKSSSEDALQTKLPVPQKEAEEPASAGSKRKPDAESAEAATEPSANGDEAAKKRKTDDDAPAVDGDSDEEKGDLSLLTEASQAAEEAAPADAVQESTASSGKDLINVDDTVCFWEEGWKERYYLQKFGPEGLDNNFVKEFTTHYVIGMCWVLKYYVHGVPSWNWYFPYHYAPFASDFIDIAEVKPEFELGTPFRSIEQLMGVFPAASRQHIPSIFHSLMTDPKSPIIDFYPETFTIDKNGEKASWLGVTLLPFINEQRLLDAMRPLYPLLDEEAKEISKRGVERLIVSKRHPLFPSFNRLYTENVEVLEVDTKISGSIAGLVRPDPQPLRPGLLVASPFPNHPLKDVKHNAALSSAFSCPERSSSEFIQRLLPGVQQMPKVLSNYDLGAPKAYRRRRRHILAKTGWRPEVDERSQYVRDSRSPNGAEGGRGIYSNVRPPPERPHHGHAYQGGSRHHAQRPAPYSKGAFPRGADGGPPMHADRVRQMQQHQQQPQQQQQHQHQQQQKQQQQQQQQQKPQQQQQRQHLRFVAPKDEEPKPEQPEPKAKPTPASPKPAETASGSAPPPTSTVASAAPAAPASVWSAPPAIPQMPIGGQAPVNPFMPIPGMPQATPAVPDTTTAVLLQQQQLQLQMQQMQMFMQMQASAMSMYPMMAMQFAQQQVPGAMPGMPGMATTALPPVISPTPTPAPQPVAATPAAPVPVAPVPVAPVPAAPVLSVATSIPTPAPNVDYAAAAAAAIAAATAAAGPALNANAAPASSAATANSATEQPKSAFRGNLAWNRNLGKKK